MQVVDGKPNTSFLTRDSDESVNSCNGDDSDVESDDDGEIQSPYSDNDGNVGNDGIVNSDVENALNGDKWVEVKDWVMVEYDQVGYPGEGRPIKRTFLKTEATFRLFSFNK